MAAVSAVRRTATAGEFSWHQFRVLLRVIRKGEKIDDGTGMGLGNDAKRGKLLGDVGRRVLMGLAYLVLAIFFFVMGLGLAASGVSVYATFSLLVVAMLVMELFLGLYQAVNMLYFVRDLSYYLTLPLSPSVVMWAKLAHFVLLSSAGNLLFLPMGLGCLWGQGAPAGSYVVMVLAFVLCSVAIVLALVMLVVPLMRFSRLARNKDRFARFFGVLITVLCLAVGVGSQFALRGDGAAAGLASGAEGLLSGGPAAIVVALLCPPSALVRWAFEGSPVVVLAAFVGMVVLVALYAAVLSSEARRWYLEGARALQGAGGEKSVRRFGAADLRRVAGARGAFAANLARDWKVMVRTPAFFNQFVMSPVLMPLYFVVIFVVVGVIQSGESGLDMGAVLGLVASVTANFTLTSPEVVVCALVVLGVAVFMGFSSYSFTMAVSRDGEDFFFLRAMPMSWTAYLAAKFVPTFALGAVPMVLLLIAALALAQMPVLVAAYLVALYVAATAALDLLALGFGARFPQLHWDNEAQVTKGGKAALIVYAGLLLAVAAMALPALVAASALVWGVSAEVALLSALALQVAEVAALAWWTLVAGARSLARRES